jgi:hypothetical protein
MSARARVAWKRKPLQAPTGAASFLSLDQREPSAGRRPAEVGRRFWCVHALAKSRPSITARRIASRSGAAAAFRSTSASAARLPLPDSLTEEGRVEEKEEALWEV